MAHLQTEKSSDGVGRWRPRWLLNIVATLSVVVVFGAKSIAFQHNAEAQSNAATLANAGEPSAPSAYDSYLTEQP